MEDKEEKPLEKQREKTLKLLDTEGVKDESHKPLADEEIDEASEDPENPEVYSEETEGKIAPESKAGSPEIDSNPDPRFSKSHEPIDIEKAKKGLGLKDIKSGGGTDDNKE